MKHLLTPALCALFLSLPVALGLAAPRFAQEDGAAPSGAERLAGMDWLAGSWAGDMWGGRFLAHYSTPAGGAILSHSRLVKDERESFYEFEVFELRGEDVFLQPYPRGAKVVGLYLASSGEHRAVFENPDKDYPTRIVYERTAEGELHITLDDPHGGSDKVERFVLRSAGS